MNGCVAPQVTISALRFALTCTQSSFAVSVVCIDLSTRIPLTCSSNPTWQADCTLRLCVMTWPPAQHTVPAPWIWSWSSSSMRGDRKTVLPSPTMRLSVDLITTLSCTTSAAPPTAMISVSERSDGSTRTRLPFVASISMDVRVDRNLMSPDVGTTHGESHSSMLVI